MRGCGLDSVARSSSYTQLMAADSSFELRGTLTLSDLLKLNYCTMLRRVWSMILLISIFLLAALVLAGVDTTQRLGLPHEDLAGAVHLLLFLLLWTAFWTLIQYLGARKIMMTQL